MSDKNPLISVIVPVYNVGEFLTPCLDSLKGQTYQNLEILLIDDGSTDGSSEQCDMYAKKDSRFKVFHKENGGVSSARNLGLDIAQGEYIAFVDADDRVLPDYFEVLYGDLVSRKADIICCNFAIVDESGSRLTSYPRDAQGTLPNVKADRLIADNQQLFLDIARKQELYFTHIIAKLMVADFAKQCRFQPLKFSEDTLYLFDVFCLDPVVALSTHAGYHYVLRSSSVTHSARTYNLRHPIDTLTLTRHQYEYFCRCNGPLKNTFLKAYANALFTYANAAAHPENREKRTAYQKQIEDHILRLQQAKQALPQKMRAKLAIYANAPWLYNLLARINDKLRG